MVYQGSNLIVSVDGSVLAASKSCTVDVQADTIKVSSPTDGAWEHIIAGRKSWQVQTSHLLVNAFGDLKKVTLTVPAWRTVEVKHITVTFGGMTFTSPDGRGLHLMRLYKNNGTWQFESTTYDTYDDDTAITNMIAAITAGDTNWSTEDIILIGSYDAWRLTEELRTKINQVLQVPADQIPLATTPTWRETAIIGSKGLYSRGEGVTSENQIAGAHISVMYGGERIENAPTVLKNSLQRVGNEVTLRMQIDGNGMDYVTGQAIVTAFKSQGSIDNLLTGSFTFKGSGPLS